MRTLQDLFLDELADMFDAEHRITKALPKLAKAATCPDLREALLNHLEETKGQITKLQKVFAAFNEKPQSKTCEATVGLLTEGDEIAAENEDEPTLNAALISAAQKVEHYEIASYGTLHAWALLLGNQKAADLIEEILDEEKAANDKLTELSENSNQEALGEDEDDQDDADSQSKPHAKSMKD
ncbi:MAG TPA: ferritin-like domain-containing protein [Candidatus Limnocylindria bacterium]|nr:ferritin-like domain-containing protein [Candidatus Limnocylindria bacterium]